MIKKTLIDKLNYNNEFEEADINEMLSFVASDEQLFKVSNITFIYTEPAPEPGPKGNSKNRSVELVNGDKKVFAANKLADLLNDSVPMYIINNKSFSFEFATKMENLIKIFDSSISLQFVSANAVISCDPSEPVYLEIDKDSNTHIDYQEPEQPEDSGEVGRNIKSVKNNNEETQGLIHSIDFIITVEQYYEPNSGELA